MDHDAATSPTAQASPPVAVASARERLFTVAPALAALLAYASSLRAGFVWDDLATIVRGRYIDSLANLPRLFLHQTRWNSGGVEAAVAAVDTYRPLTMATFFVERALFGKTPLPFHATNLVIHGANALLVGVVARRLGLRRPFDLIAALLFAVHPGVAEAVHWINGRSDPLCVLLLLLGLLAFLPPPGAQRSPLRLAAVAAAAFAATLCKETAFLAAPPLLLLAPHLGLRRRPLLRAIVPWAVGLGGGALLRLAVLRGAAASEGSAHAWWAAQRLPALWLDGLSTLLAPRAKMQPSLHEAYLQPHLASTVAGLGALLLLGAVAARRRRRGDPFPLWATTTFLVTLAPVAMLTWSEGWSGWGRYLYPCLPALAIALGWELAGAWGHLRPPLRRLVAVALVVLVLLLGGQTFAFGFAWRDARARAEAMVDDHPESSIGWGELAEVAYNEGRLEEAQRAIDEALRRSREESPRHLARAARILHAAGERPRAYAINRRALALDPTVPSARYLRAIELFEQRREVAAATLFVELLTADPGDPGLWRTVEAAARRSDPGAPFVTALREAAEQARDPGLAARLRALRP